MQKVKYAPKRKSWERIRMNELWKMVCCRSVSFFLIKFSHLFLFRDFLTLFAACLFPSTLHILPGNLFVGGRGRRGRVNEIILLLLLNPNSMSSSPQFVLPPFPTHIYPPPRALREQMLPFRVRVDLFLPPGFASNQGESLGPFFQLALKFLKCIVVRWSGLVTPSSGLSPPPRWLVCPSVQR